MPIPKLIFFDYGGRFFSFLDRIADRDKLVILMTADDEDRAFSYRGVDAMTAASNPEDEDCLVERLRNEFDRVVGRVDVSIRVPPIDSRTPIALCARHGPITSKEVTHES